MKISIKEPTLLLKKLCKDKDKQECKEGPICFTDDSLFEVTFPDGHQVLWNPMQGITTTGME